MPDGFWGCLCGEKYFQYILILASVLFALYHEALVVYREDDCRECKMSWVRIYRGQKFSFNSLLYLEWNVKNCFVKHIKLQKVLKIKKNNFTSLLKNKQLKNSLNFAIKRKNPTL